MEVTLNLPENVYHQAARLAQLLNRDVPHVLADTLTGALASLGTSAVDLTPIAELSDNELLGVAELRISAEPGERLGVLLEHQQSGPLNELERSELAALMQIYHECLVRKAQALREAVRRGLREPLGE